MSIVLTALFALAAPQQTGAQILYTPVRSALDQKIVVKGWGSGSGSETDEAVYEGAHSIRVSTRNYFQGANIDFGDPKDLSDRYADRNNLLKVVLKTADDNSTAGGTGGPGKGGGMGPGGPGGMGGPGGPGGLGGPGGPGGAGRGGGGFPGGGPGGPGGGGFPGGGGRGGQGGGPGGPGGGRGGQGGFPGGPGGGRGGQGGFPGGPGGMGAASTAPAFTTVRMIVTTTDGKKSEAYLPIATSSSGERGWKTVAIPLQAISGFDRTNKTIKDIAFSGDTTTTFYVGELRIVNDPTPLRGDILGQRTTYNLALGDKVTFSARGEGGSSVLEYVWDFDDADGTDDVDAIGQTVAHQFRRATPEGKDTIVTLTVRDKYGLKPAFKTSVKVHVNP